jgi:hypothetical protein
MLQRQKIVSDWPDLILRHCEQNMSELNNLLRMINGVIDERTNLTISRDMQFLLQTDYAHVVNRLVNNRTRPMQIELSCCISVMEHFLVDMYVRHSNILFVHGNIRSMLPSIAIDTRHRIVRRHCPSLKLTFGLHERLIYDIFTNK